MKGLALAVSAVIALSGCGQDQSITHAQNEIASLARRVSQLESENALVSRRAAALEASASGRGTVVLDPAASSGYGVLQTTHGLLVVSINGIEPLADGSRISVRIGNLTSASITGGTVRVTYGPRYDPEKKSTVDWLNSLRTSEVDIVDTIGGGSWTNFSTPLPGFRPDQIGHFEMALEPTTISLYSQR